MAEDDVSVTPEVFDEDDCDYVCDYNWPVDELNTEERRPVFDNFIEDVGMKVLADPRATITFMTESDFLKIHFLICE